MVKLEKVAGIATITLNNPPVNCLDRDFFMSMIEIFNDLSSDSDVHVVFLESSLEKVFSFGLEPQMMLDHTPQGRAEIFKLLGELSLAMIQSYVPTVGVINGAAIAGGAVLMGLMDFNIMHEDGKICFSESKIGLPLPQFLFEVLNQKASGNLFLEMTLLGKNIDANSAKDSGFISAIYKTTEERDHLKSDLAGKISRVPKAVMAENLKRMKAGYLTAVNNFITATDGDDPFLGEDFLGKGLKLVLERQSK